MTLFPAWTLACFPAVVSPLGPRAGDPGQAQAETSVLVTYDLRAVLPRWDESTTWSMSLSLPPAATLHQELLSAGPAYGELAAFELLDLLSQILGDELRREGRELVVEDAELTVLAPETVHEQVRAVLDALRLALGATVALRVDVLTLGEGSPVELVPAGALPEEQAAQLVASLVGRGAQHKSFRLELSAGRTSWLDARKRIPFVFDYDVEIAQASVVFDPICTETFEGTRLGMRAAPAAGGLALSAVIQRSELLGPIAEHALGVRGFVNPVDAEQPQLVQGPGVIQTPEVLVRGLAFDTVLPDGKALALTLEAELGAAEMREVVLLRRVGGALSPSYFVRPIPRTNRTLIALNSELFRAPRLSANAEAWVDEAGIPTPQVSATLSSETPSFLLEWLKVRFSVWRRFGPWILVVTDPAWDRDAGSELERLVQARRGERRLVTVGLDLRAQGREQPFPVRLRLPLAEGSSAGVLVARGRTAVTEYDVEVAQSAAVPDPYVRSLFEGLALALSLEGTTCETSGMAQLFDGDLAQLDPRYEMIGPIARPEPRALGFDERLTLPEGATARASIGAVSERADQQGLSLELSIGTR